MDKTSTPSGPVATMADVRRGGDVVFFLFPSSHDRKLIAGQGLSCHGNLRSGQWHSAMESKERGVWSLFWRVWRRGIALSAISTTCSTAGHLATPPIFCALPHTESGRVGRFSTSSRAAAASSLLM